MMFKTHLAIGALAGITLFHYYIPEHPFLFAFIFLFASILPDIDTTKSVIGKRLWPVSSFLSIFTRHRGFFHTIWIPLAAFGIGFYFNIGLFAAFTMGYLVHLLSDAMTSEGISLFSPVLKRRTKGFIKTGSALEYVFLVFVCVGIGLQAALSL
ncbi:MAG: metal-dependent hydrolase [Candidatus Nanoarchaeia archaeon]|nr:metal-dependent hydrolase [Candidatus Nanoarchaeia archaeon]